MRPTIQSTAAGDYEDYAEQTFQYRGINGDTTTPTPIDARKKAIFEFIGQQGNTSDDMAIVNKSYVHMWGQGGWLVAPKFGAAPSPSNPFSLANPVNSSTRGPNNAPINICQFPTTIKIVEGDTGFSTGKH